MEKVIEKFNLYDLMGIWGPGVIAITYFYFTSHEFLLSIMHGMGISRGFLSDNQIIAISCTVIAYMVGVLLHEAGKLLIDPILKSSTAHLDGFSDYESKRNAIRFSKDIDLSRIDKYHSVYALSKSLSVCFAIHEVLIISQWVVFVAISYWQIIIDFLLVLLLFERAHRFYKEWVTSILAVYDLRVKDKSSD